MSQLQNRISTPLEESEKSAKLAKLEKQGESVVETEGEAKPAKIGRFRTQYNKYKSKGKWFLIGFIVFYTIRDTLLYIVLPWYLAKSGLSLWDVLFGE